MEVRLPKGFLGKRWVVGFHDRGHGHGDFAVIVEGSEELIVKAPSREVAEHIATAHNALLGDRSC